MYIKVYNNKNIKLQGVSYYYDSYKYWDLNLCKKAFENDYFDLVPQVNKGRFHNMNMPMAVIDLGLYNHKFSNYWDKLSHNVKRDINTAEKNNFYFKKYNFNHHIYDFLEINKSQNKIKKVNPWYLNDPEFHRGSHSGYLHEWEDESHYSQWYGVFKYFKHYKQGELTTNEKLFAYCKLAVDGELATVTLIWGHQKHLNKGLMYYLITSVVKDILPTNIRYLQYYTAGQYSTWKSRMLFRPIKYKIIL
jgi:hypothetical protein